jgi:hypothetical protein
MCIKFQVSIFIPVVQLCTIKSLGHLPSPVALSANQKKIGVNQFQLLFHQSMKYPARSDTLSMTLSVCNSPNLIYVKLCSNNRGGNIVLVIYVIYYLSLRHITLRLGLRWGTDV